MVDVGIVVLYLLVTLAIGIYSGRKIKTIRDFAIGDQNFATPVLMAGIAATAIGGENCLGMAEEVFKSGAGLVVIFFGCVIATLIMAYIIAPKMKRFLGMISIGEIMKDLYGKPGQLITGIAGTLLCVGYVGAQVCSIGYILNYFLGVSPILGTVLGASIVVIYSSVGGIRAVTITDVVQFGVLMIAIPTICSVGLDKIGGIETLIAKVPNEHLSLIPKGYTTTEFFTLLLIFSVPFLDPSFSQRLLMAKDVNQITRTMSISALSMIPYTIIVGLIGLTALAMNADLTPGLAMPYLANTVLPIGLKGLAIAGMLAVIMSTADSYLNSASILIVHDVIGPLSNKKLSDKSEIQITRITTLIIGILAVWTAVSFERIIEIVLNFLNCWGPIIVVPLFAGISGMRVKTISFVTSAIAGFSFFLVWQIFPLESLFGFDSLLPAMCANAVTFFTVNRLYVTPEPKPIAPAPNPTFTPMKEHGQDSQQKRKKLSFKIVLEAANSFCHQRVQDYGAQYVVFGVFVVINFILPFFMWSSGEQTRLYDVRLALRVTAGILCFILIMKDYWPAKIKPYLPLYWYGTLLYTLPFLTTFMLLDSNATMDWLLNMVLALFLLAILVDWISFTLILPMGVALGYGFYWLLTRKIGGLNLSPHNTYLAIYMYVFTIMIGLVFSRNKERWMMERLQAMKALSAAIAHEMRTPLSAIGYSTGALSRHLPGFMKLHQSVLNGEKDLKVEEIDARTWKNLETLPARLTDTSRKAQNVIDMLLTKLQESGQEALTKCSARESVEKALEGYPFSEKEQDLVTFESTEDFVFKGHQQLIVHVFFNLLKNALYHVKAANRGAISISIQPGASENTIVFRDTGPGIPMLQLPFIFERFYTKTRHGTGIGLAFCKQVLQGFGGDITCDSEMGSYTEFTLTFPPYSEKDAKPEKKDFLARLIQPVGELQQELRAAAAGR